MKKFFVVIALAFALVGGLLSASCKGEASKIEFSEKEVSVYLSEGSSYVPVVNVFPGSASYSLSSSNDTLAKVNDDRVSLTLVRAPGIVVITATSGDKSATQILMIFASRAENPSETPEEPEVKDEYYTVVFMPGYGSIPDQQVAPGGKAVDPNMDSYMNGMMLEGWYSSEDYSVRYDFDTPVSSNIILFAHWIPVASPIFNYEVWNGNLYVTGVYYTYIKYTEIYFPSTAPDGSVAGKTDVSGREIYGIYKGAFKGKTSLKSVTVPDSYKEIGDEAFSGCSALETVNFLGEGLATVGKQAFLDCVALTTFKLPSTLTELGELAFYNCKELADIGGIPTGLKTIGVRTFAETKITGADLSGVDTICSRAFYNCLYLNNVTGVENATSVGSYAFFGSPYLKNLIGRSHDGLVYAGNTLLYYSPKSGVHDVTVKSNVNLIAGCAISDGITSDKTFRFLSAEAPKREDYAINSDSVAEFIEIIVPESAYKNYYDGWYSNRSQIYYEDTPEEGLTVRVQNAYNGDKISAKTVAIMKYTGAEQYLDLATLFDAVYQTEDYSYKVSRVNTGAFYGLGSDGNYNDVGKNLKTLVLPICTQSLERNSIAWLKALNKIEFKGSADRYPSLFKAASGAIANIKNEDYKIYVPKALVSAYKSALTNYQSHVIGVE